MTRDTLALYVAAGILLLWGIGVIVAVLDGNEMVKIMTGPMGIVIGWVFAKTATTA